MATVVEGRTTTRIGFDDVSDEISAFIFRADG
jgi:hypothetical protein